MICEVCGIAPLHQLCAGGWLTLTVYSEAESCILFVFAWRRRWRLAGRARLWFTLVLIVDLLNVSCSKSFAIPCQLLFLGRDSIIPVATWIMHDALEVIRGVSLFWIPWTIIL